MSNHPYINPTFNLAAEEAKLRKLLPAMAVDALGWLKVAVADLTHLEQILKDKLEASGKTEIDGSMFRATIVTSERTSTDKTYKEKLAELISKGMSRQFIAAHTQQTESVSVRVVAKVRDKAAA